MLVVDLIGEENLLKLLSSSQNNGAQQSPLILIQGDASENYLEPIRTQSNDGRGNTVEQVLFRDVTQELHRQKGLKAYAAYVIQAQEDERQRIARELHDEAIQTLILLCRRLSFIESADETLSPSTIEGLRDARRIAEQLVGGLRDYARALRPQALEDLGVIVSIRRLLEDFTERTGIPGHLRIVGEEQRQPGDTELSMFRIAQEALTNVDRHAKATGVVVTVTFAENEAKLDVQDNGVGFNVPPALEELSIGGQLGLLGMHERAELLGGYLRIQSIPGKGTTITFSCPRRSLGID